MYLWVTIGVLYSENEKKVVEKSRSNLDNNFLVDINGYKL